VRPNHVYRPPPQYRAPQLYRKRPIQPYTLSWLFDRATEQYIVLTTPLDSDSPFASLSPAIATGDIWVLKLVTTPDGYTLTPLADGTASWVGSGGTQSWLNKLYDASLSAYYATDEDGDYFSIIINDQAPVETAPIPDQQAYTNVLFEGPILDDYVDEPEGQAITYDFTLGDALPSGLSVQTVVLNSGQPNERTVQRIRGTPAGGTQGTYDIVMRASDPGGNQTTLTGWALTVDVGVLVPTVDGGSLTVDAAGEDVADSGLIVGDLIAEVNGSVTEGNVFDQDPEGGTYAIPGSPVVLYVSGIEIPDVIGDPRANAESEITTAGLGVTVSLVKTNAYTPDTVMFQNPAAGLVVMPDQVVTLTVARAFPLSQVTTITRKRFT